MGDKAGKIGRLQIFFLKYQVEIKPLSCTLMKRIHRAKVSLLSWSTQQSMCGCLLTGMCFVKVDVGQEFDF